MRRPGSSVVVLRRRIVSGCSIFWVAALPLAGCGTPRPAVPVAPAVTMAQKLGWILRLEDQRILRDPAAAPAGTVAGAAGQVGVAPVAARPVPDLILLVADPEAAIRRRAALALGRVGLAEGVAPLANVLATDPDEEVRQMAAFALGLIGDRGALDPLVKALADASVMVQARSVEALGLIGDPSAAQPVGDAVLRVAADPAIAALDPDDLRHPLPPAAELYRLGLYALVRLKAYDQIAAATLGPGGEPRVRWWPVAFALQRVEDPRAAPALRALARGKGNYTAAFAARGLGTLKDQEAGDVLMPLLDRARDPRVRVAAIRAVAQIGERRAILPLIQIAESAPEPELRAEAVAALGTLRATEASDLLLDLIADSWPTMRAAALKAVADLNDGTFLTVLSGLDPDPHYSVQAALAGILATQDAQLAVPRLVAMLNSSDQRSIPAVLSALVSVKAPDAPAILIAHLEKPDFAVRAAAASGLGELLPSGGVAALQAAVTRAAGDPTYVARAAALSALAKYRTPEAIATLKQALQDRDWATRVRVATLLNEIEPSGAYVQNIRPAPTRLAPGRYGAADLVQPTVSPHVYLDTEKGTIQIELAVLDAPLTSQNFIELAAKGFYDGLPLHRVVPNFVIQDGDPRGDGEGGPGYTIRDELNERPYLRGTVGMALDWRDTGGSQWFITHSPQPHLDARYTVFGRVVAGMEVVDRLQQWDTIRRVRVWDGTRMTRQ